MQRLVLMGIALGALLLAGIAYLFLEQDEPTPDLRFAEYETSFSEEGRVMDVTISVHNESDFDVVSDRPYIELCATRQCTTKKIGSLKAGETRSYDFTFDALPWSSTVLLSGHIGTNTDCCAIQLDEMERVRIRNPGALPFGG